MNGVNGLYGADARYATIAGATPMKTVIYGQMSQQQHQADIGVSVQD